MNEALKKHVESTTNSYYHIDKKGNWYAKPNKETETVSREQILGKTEVEPKEETEPKETKKKK